jgi:hypothetical protein
MSKKTQALDNLLDAKDRGWVRMVTTTWHRSTMVLDLAVDSRRNGSTREAWRVRCKEVREYKFTDANGGGLAVYDETHPVVRQHVEDVVALRVRGKARQVGRAVGDLLRVHGEMVDDWIAFDRYLGNTLSLFEKLATGQDVLAEGPKFLLEAYAEALRAVGLKARLVHQKKARPGAVALHLGDSFIVARSILAERVADAPED